MKPAPPKHLWLTLPFLLLILVFALSPIIDRDALIHHMALPKIWLTTGPFHVEPFKLFSFYPSNIQFLYYLALTVHGEFLPKILHASFLIFTSILVYRYILQYTGMPFLALLGFVFHTTIPINQRLASEVYVDLSLAFFSTLALLYFLKWKNAQCSQEGYLYLSAIGAGLTAGTKYNGLIVVLILTFFVVYAYAREKKQNLAALYYGSKFFIIALIFLAPWLVRNYLASGGNPFYPLFPSIFHSDIEILQPVFQEKYSEILFRSDSGETFIDILLIPIRFFFTGQDNNFLQFDGKLNPMMLMLFPILYVIPFNKKKKNISIISDEKYMLVFSIFILFVSMNFHIRTRYIIAIVPPMIILNIFAIKRLLESSKKYVNSIAYVLAIFYILYNVNYSFELFRELDIYKYMLAKETRVEYLRRKLSYYSIYEFINHHTPENAVIYDVLCGQRSYYVDRAYIHDANTTDAYFYNYVFQEKEPLDYLNYLQSIKLAHGVKATHVLINTALFTESFKRIFSHPQNADGHDNVRKLRKFFAFLTAQKLLLQHGDAALYELVYPDDDPGTWKESG
jgi:hypothetical protein